MLFNCLARTFRFLIIMPALWAVFYFLFIGPSYPPSQDSPSSFAMWGLPFLLSGSAQAIFHLICKTLYVSCFDHYICFIFPHEILSILLWNIILSRSKSLIPFNSWAREGIWFPGTWMLWIQASFYFKVQVIKKKKETGWQPSAKSGSEWKR